MARSDHDALAAQLHAAERGEAAPWARERPVTWWFPPLFGVIGALFVLSYRLADDAAFPLAVPCLMLAAWAAIYVNSRRRGPAPRGSVPREFAQSALGYLLRAAAAFVAVCAVMYWFGTWPGAVTALVLGWTVMAWSERSEVRAARRVRERLS